MDFLDMLKGILVILFTSHLQVDWVYSEERVVFIG